MVQEKAFFCRPYVIMPWKEVFVVVDADLSPERRLVGNKGMDLLPIKN